MRATKLPIGLLLAVILCGSGPAWAQTPSLQPFFGSYEGTALFDASESENRELTVIIRPFGEGGFSVRWRTIIFKPDEEPPRGRTQVIYFAPSEVFPDVFAATPPEDAAGLASDVPLEGRPFAWARIAGKTLTVNVLSISETGAYVVQTYDRTLTGGGLALRFSRIRNGEVEQTILGELDRTGD
jgi:hypothetical protein